MDGPGKSICSDIHSLAPATGSENPAATVYLVLRGKPGHVLSGRFTHESALQLLKLFCECENAVNDSPNSGSNLQK